ncbi:MAG: RNA polymerase sigma factor [Olsenella sp.]|nr:RNA polymerase sigma factor [Olsenella sp.]
MAGGAQLAATLDIEQVFRRNAQAVYRVCYSFLGSAADAEDATQATFMRLIDHPRTFEDDGHERAWLITVASNLCRDILKSAARTRTVAMPEGVEYVDERASADQVDETVEAVMRLPEKYKDVVYLHYYEGMPTDEIARVVGSPPSTVRNRLRDARALLRKMLEDDG